MKKIILIALILLSTNMSFAGQNSSSLDKLENSVFGFTYMDSDEERVSRLEESIYGVKKSGNLNTRISELNKDMSADSIGKEIKPKEDTFADDDMYPSEDRLARDYIPPAGANVDYPSVNELENEVFKKEFKNIDLTTRLANLEKETFGKTYNEDSFSSRVERLQGQIKPKSFAKNLAQSSNNFYDNDYSSFSDNYHLDEYSAPDFDYESYNRRNTPPSRVNLASVERSMYKKSFTKEELDSRLTRLENTMFGTSFEADSQQERINRIASAYKAQKSASKYDSNKFTQNMAAATQIGMLILMILACVL